MELFLLEFSDNFNLTIDFPSLISLQPLLTPWVAIPASCRAHIAGEDLNSVVRNQFFLKNPWLDISLVAAENSDGGNKMHRGEYIPFVGDEEEHYESNIDLDFSLLSKPKTVPPPLCGGREKKSGRENISSALYFPIARLPLFADLHQSQTPTPGYSPVPGDTSQPVG
ncbi:hypothetical protein KSP40_PGU018507 [Platanthera guangdongensis]|uniref:Uncharacterized protein n=1 Tax=Platanthera guangdongensis TaxID=2320717 RepID=A0ABR2M456_9ASPA